jgi:crossover junction endodeoxyribonuclease RusA
VTGTGGPASSPPVPGRAGAPQFPAVGAGANPAPSAGLTYTIALPAGLKLLSLNDRLHWRERNSRAQELKRAAWVMALNAKVPRLERVSVVVEYQPPDRRERDADNISPAGKAALDGIVAARILRDDSKTYVTGVRCVIGEPFPKGRLVLHLTEVAALAGLRGAG